MPKPNLGEKLFENTFQILQQKFWKAFENFEKIFLKFWKKSENFET